MFKESNITKLEVIYPEIPDDIMKVKLELDLGDAFSIQRDKLYWKAMIGGK